MAEDSKKARDFGAEVLGWRVIFRRNAGFLTGLSNITKGAVDARALQHLALMIVAPLLGPSGNHLRGLIEHRIRSRRKERESRTERDQLGHFQLHPGSTTDPMRRR